MVVWENLTLNLVLLPPAALSLCTPPFVFIAVFLGLAGPPIAVYSGLAGPKTLANNTYYPLLELH